MSNPVSLRMLVASSSPSGTGSYTYQAHYQIVVENIAYAKQVSIWGTASGNNWQDYPAGYAESTPGNLEIWTLDTFTEIRQFVVKYTVNGITYWDNNGGADYRPHQVTDELDVLLGNGVEVVAGPTYYPGTPNLLRLNVGVRNLAYVKVVGAVYTTDHWATVQTANGYYSTTLPGGTEVWDIDLTVGMNQNLEYALFYNVLGQTYWDNNFLRNYSLLTAAALRAKAGGAPETWEIIKRKPTPAARPVRLVAAGGERR